MDDILSYLDRHRGDRVEALRGVVAIPSVSPGRRHQREIEDCAEAFRKILDDAGLQNATLLRTDGSNPYVYAEWLGAPGKPTILYYSHLDVQPAPDSHAWHDAGTGVAQEDRPWTLTAREGRLYGRGAADDKGGALAQIFAVAAYLKVRGALPVNVKILIESEEEISSEHIGEFFRTNRDLLKSDVIVVCDTSHLATGSPALTYSLRGIAALEVKVRTAESPVHSGLAGGAVPDAAQALCKILARLYDEDGRIQVPHLYDRVQEPTENERSEMKRLPSESEFKVLPGVRLANEAGLSLNEQIWRRPSITVKAIEASSFEHASNQVLPSARALLSCRLVPDQDPKETVEQLTAFLKTDPPYGAEVVVTPSETGVYPWTVDPHGPAFDAAVRALEAGFGRRPAMLGSGGSIGFVGPLSELFGGAPALLFGVTDAQSAIHSHNESLHEEDWHRLTASLAHLLENLGGGPA